MKNHDIAMLLIRLGLGVSIFMHGLNKIFNGLSFVRSVVLKLGLPEFVSYGVYLSEIIAPIMLMIGFYSRLGAFVIICSSIFIIYATYPNPLALTSHGGFSAEILYLYIFSSFCIVFNGSGKYALKKD